MAFQGTYAVADLDLDNTYETSRKCKDVTGCSDISRGTFSFWFKVDKDKIKVQISRDHVNIWHKNENYIDKTFQNLKFLIVKANGKKCEHFVLQKMQRIGSTSTATELTTDVDLPIKLENAEGDFVQQCVKIINNTESKDLLHSRLDQLHMSSWRERLGIYEELFSCLEGCLENPLVFENPETYRLVHHIFRGILSVENQIADNNSKRIRDRIKNEISLKIIKVVTTKPELIKYSITFLGQSGRKEAVDLFFNHINKEPSIVLEGVVDSLFYDFALALANLYDQHRSKIDCYFDQMIDNSDNVKTQAGTRLRRRMHEIFLNRTGA